MKDFDRLLKECHKRNIQSLCVKWNKIWNCQDFIPNRMKNRVCENGKHRRCKHRNHKNTTLYSHEKNKNKKDIPQKIILWHKT